MTNIKLARTYSTFFIKSIWRHCKIGYLKSLVLRGGGAKRDFAWWRKGGRGSRSPIKITSFAQLHYKGIPIKCLEIFLWPKLYSLPRNLVWQAYSSKHLVYFDNSWFLISVNRAPGVTQGSLNRLWPLLVCSGQLRAWVPDTMCGQYQSYFCLSAEEAYCPTGKTVLATVKGTEVGRIWLTLVGYWSVWSKTNHNQPKPTKTNHSLGLLNSCFLKQHYDFLK